MYIVYICIYIIYIYYILYIYIYMLYYMLYILCIQTYLCVCLVSYIFSFFPFIFLCALNFILRNIFSAKSPFIRISWFYGKSVERKPNKHFCKMTFHIFAFSNYENLLLFHFLIQDLYHYILLKHLVETMIYLSFEHVCYLNHQVLMYLSENPKKFTLFLIISIAVINYQCSMMVSCKKIGYRFHLCHFPATTWICWIYAGWIVF